MQPNRTGWAGRAATLGATVVLGAVLASPMAAAGREPSGADSAHVRVNQVGYPSTASKRAYLMATAPETGAVFTVRTAGGHDAYSASVGPDIGRWSDAYLHVYALDFSSLRTAGTYSISVSGPIHAASPTFAIGSGSDLYASALANSLSFYQNMRDGPDYIPSPLRDAPGHLNDAHAMTYKTPVTDSDGNFKGDLTALGVRVDATGGWWDAGDYPKFVETTSYTVDLLLAGVRDFPDQMGAGSARSDFTAEARFGTEWLLKMWDGATKTFYYQVGIGQGNAHTYGDHDIWRLPEADDTYGGTNPLYRYIRNRPVFRTGRPGTAIPPQMAGRDAAAFALCYQVFRRSHPAFATTCLHAAERVFDLADLDPRGDLITVIPFDFYGETEWHSDMELGATELYFALADGDPPAGLPHTNPAHYLHEAARWARAYISSPGEATDTLNLYDVSGLAHFELYRAIGDARTSSPLHVTQDDLLADLKKQLDNAVAQAATDPFGFGFPWDQYDTTSRGAGLTVVASEYGQLTGSSTYSDYSQRWLANILGANAWGTSLIVGDGSTFPNCMQHQVANIAGSLDGSAPVLAGAAVEGPNAFATRGRLSRMRRCPPDRIDRFARFNSRHAVYKDNVQSYSTVEPAIDLTASSPLAFARQMAGLF